jgi:hypothetical protein
MPVRDPRISVEDWDRQERAGAALGAFTIHMWEPMWLSPTEPTPQAYTVRGVTGFDLHAVIEQAIVEAQG